MRIAAWAGVVALAVAGPAVAQTRPTVAQAFDNSCVAEAIPVAGICRVVGTATLAPGPDGRQMGWRLYDVVSSSGRRGLSVILADDRPVAQMAVSARAVDAWSRNPYVVASTVESGDDDYAVMWMRGEDVAGDLAVWRLDGGAFQPIAVAGLWPSVGRRLEAVAPQCFPIGSDINWRTFGLRYDMMGDDGACGLAILGLGVENGAVTVTDAMVVRKDLTPKRKARHRRR